MNAYWKIGLYLACITVNLAIGWHLHTIYDQAEMAKEYRDQIEATQKAQQEANDRAEDLEKKLAAERQTTQTLNTKMEANLAKNPVYTGCKLPADGVRLLNDAIAGHPAR